MHGWLELTLHTEAPDDGPPPERIYIDFDIVRRAAGRNTIRRELVDLADKQLDAVMQEESKKGE